MSCIRPGRILALGLAAGLWLAGPAAAFPEQEQVLLEEGFEADFGTLTDLGSAWAIWGPAAGKIPANFTRDPTAPHSGQACLRIRRPGPVANQWFGLPVTNPEFLLPQPGRRYTISFWARSPEPATASLGIFSYRRLNPAVDGPNLGIRRFATDPTWRQFSYTVTAGRDFFASHARYLYFAFFIATDVSRERTMWLDDVVMSTAAAGGAAGAVLDDSKLAVPPLPLRLLPGPALKVELDAAKRLHPSNRKLGGSSMLSLARWTGKPFDQQGAYSLPPALEEAIRDLRLPLTRFYGLLEDEPFPTPEAALDKIAEFLDRVGIPQETTIIELEDYLANRRLDAATWGRTVAYAGQRGYRFRHWEVGNEVYMLSAASGGQAGRAFPAVEDYIAHFREVAQAIRTAQPEARIGLSVDTQSVAWGNYLVQACAGSYDFVCPHWYGRAIARDFSETVLGENHDKFAAIRRWNALLQAVNPGRPVVQYDSEWGLHESTPDGRTADFEVKNGNVFGTVYRAVRLLYCTREDLLAGASGWNTLSGSRAVGFAMLYHDRPEARSMLYWLYYYYNRHLGDDVLDLAGTAPYYRLRQSASLLPTAPEVPATPVLATLDRDGRTLYLMAVNGFWDRAVEAEVQIAGFRMGPATGVVLASDDLNASPILPAKDRFVQPLALRLDESALRFTLPAHAIVFLQVQSAASAP